MPDYLSEADWKSVLNKPKNLGLKAQKTGVSEKLRAYERSNATFESKPSRTSAQSALKAVQDLRHHAKEQSQDHDAFTEATTYLNRVVTAAREREEELSKRVDELEEALEAEHDRKDIFRDLAHKLEPIIDQNEAATTLGEVAGALKNAETLLTTPAKTKESVNAALRDVQKAASIVEQLTSNCKNQPEHMKESFTETAVNTSRQRADEVLKKRGKR